MGAFYLRLFGVPFSRKDRDALFATMLDGRTGAAAVDFVRADVTHNTEKSGALLAAQAIFVVVDTFLLERGGPKRLLIGSIFLLLACSLMVMSNLRPTLSMYSRSTFPARGVFEILLARTVRLNVALYLTFLSILLLALAATILASR